MPPYRNRRCAIKFKGGGLDRLIAWLLGGTVPERTVQGKKLNVVIATGDYAAMASRLAVESSRLRRQIETVQGCYRVTVRTPAPDTYPALDEFLALAPATADDKTSRVNFESDFAALVGQGGGSCGVRRC